jgi:uncharacterized protein (DUF2062 family)
MDETSAGARPRHLPTRIWRLLLLHPVRLIKKLLAEHATPRSLGLAGAFGAFAGTLPILGLHTVLVYFGAQRLMLNRLLALGANQLGMPPIVPALCIEVGHYLRHGTWLTEVSMRTLGREAPQRFWEWTLGSLVVGPVLAVVVGGAIWLLATVLQRRAPAGGDCACGVGMNRGEAPLDTGAGQAVTHAVTHVDRCGRRSTLL